MRRMRDARRSRWGVASCLVRVNYKKCCLHLIVTNSKYRHLMIAANFRCHSIIKMGTQLLRICSLQCRVKVLWCVWVLCAGVDAHTHIYMHTVNVGHTSLRWLTLTCSYLLLRIQSTSPPLTLSPLLFLLLSFQKANFFDDRHDEYF